MCIRLHTCNLREPETQAHLKFEVAVDILKTFFQNTTVGFRGGLSVKRFVALRVDHGVSLSPVTPITGDMTVIFGIQSNIY